MTSTAYDIRTGQHITGSYFDTPVAGTVTKTRTNSMNHRIVMLYVDLDTPTVIDGTARTDVLLSVDGYTGRDAEYGDCVDL